MPATAPWSAAGELAASRHGTFTRRQAASVGLRPDMISKLLDDRLLSEPVPGVLVLASAPTSWRQQLCIATQWSNHAGVIGFRSAAALADADGYWPGSVELLLRSPRKPRIENIVHHVGPLEDIDIREIDGIPCTTIERTLCDLGSVDGELRVLQAFEWAWRRGMNLTTFQHTIDRLHRPGQHGTRVAQNLLLQARLHGRPTESALEVRLEMILADIEGLVRQHEIFDPAGNFVARVDFAIPPSRLAIEAHSKQFHSGAAAEQRDRARHRRITAQGWRVRYITNDQMKQPITVRSSILREVALAETHLRRT